MMKRILTAACLLVLTAPLRADAPKIDRRNSGLFLQQFKNENLMYIVDPLAQMCFAATFGDSGITEIDCWALSRRPGWNAIIRWVPPQPPESESTGSPP